MKGKIIKLLILTLVILLIPMAVTNAEELTKFNVNGENLTYESSMVFNGRTYIPVRDFSELVGANVVWNSDKNRVELTKHDVELYIYANDKKAIFNDQIYYMDSPLMLKDGITYAPIRFIAEAFYHNVSWDKENNTIYISEKATYIVKEEDTLASISSQLNIPIENLIAWNNLSSEEVSPNMKLKLEPVTITAIDEIRTNAVISYKDTELDLLAKIVFTEARDEPYEGYLAVAAVVINRVESPNFPDTIYDVIYQPGQFYPVKSGKINEVVPDENSYKAAKEALLGADPVNGALYFYNPRISGSGLFSNKEFIKTIGNHNFYK